MTVLHSGSTVEYQKGWEKIFGKAKKKKATTKKATAKKKPAKKKATKKKAKAKKKS